MKRIRLYCNGEPQSGSIEEGCPMKIKRSCLRYTRGTQIAAEMYRDLDESLFNENESKCSKFVPAALALAFLIGVFPE